MVLQATSTCTQCWSSNRRRLPRGILWVVTTPMSSPRRGGARPPWNAAPKGVQPEGVKLTLPGPVSAFAMENPTWRSSAGRACYTVLPLCTHKVITCFMTPEHHAKLPYATCPALPTLLHFPYHLPSAHTCWDSWSCLNGQSAARHLCVIKLALQTLPCSTCV